MELHVRVEGTQSIIYSTQPKPPMQFVTHKRWVQDYTRVLYLKTKHLIYFKMSALTQTIIRDISSMAIHNAIKYITGALHLHLN